MKRVVISGVRSFTGAHIARAFVDAGWRVTGLLAGDQTTDGASALTQARMDYASVHEWIPNAPFGSTAVIEYLQREKVDAFVNHGASIQGYRQPDFDWLGSVATATHGAPGFFKALAEAGCRRWLHSGSIFEPDEGSGQPGTELSSEAISIYGVSKQLSWQTLRFFGAQAGLAVSKIVIPNPVGRFENADRLFPFFVKTWKAGQRPVLKTPQLVRDNLPAEWLAKIYVAEASRGGDVSCVRRPSGFTMTNQEFVKLFLAQLEAAGGPHYELEIQPAESREPLVRKNLEPSPELYDAQARADFWDAWFRQLEVI